jgi:hypothetical protein
MSNPFALAFQFAASLVGLRPFEAPPYTVLARLGDGVEVRQYGARLAAETVAPGPERRARGEAFGRLARYIFGGNGAGAKIAMTAPVAMRFDGRVAGGAMRMRFFLPAAITPGAAPPPSEGGVSVVELPPEVFAVLRRSGAPWRALPAGKAALVRALEGSGWRQAGEPEAWFYDPPTTPGPLRRNEVAVRVTAAA